ncbi:sensor histidine kinase [Caldinitratiruptor microaerophilus]|uniref:histidine kinase n=1 Tax=Caldinitratiruptor microaerophilus TaxID=671077 RepID=A0AA35CKS9_9FIRM|nr:sensor histidine kinase [Caldinitratiruptor microaerophilus]BDG60253.1 hypothetical protein caldi_13430 [Caldinitratiruptor microaerophilus]
MGGRSTPVGPESAAHVAQAWVASLTAAEARARRLAGALASPAGAAPGPVAEAMRLADDLASLAREVTAASRQVLGQPGGSGSARDIGMSAIRIQEEERRRVAREIHDGPAQLLANVVLRIDVCLRLLDQDRERLRQELSQLKDLVRISLQDVRKVIFDLRPMALDDLGLVPALRAYIKEYQSRTGVEVDLASFGADRRFDPALEIAVFRSVQEALTNVARHSGASRAQVTVEVRQGELRATVQDNGVGFDPALQGRREGSFGLAGMAERARVLGGWLEVESQPGQGTRLQFVVPVLPASDA